MRMIISFAALFLSVVLLQFATGGVGPLDALSGFALGFDKEQIGLLGSAHFLGFLWAAGGRHACWAASAIRAALRFAPRWEPWG